VVRKFVLLCLGLAWSLAACGPAQASVVIEWATANEVNTAGFNLYRGDSPAGPFTLVNSSLIPASSDPLTGGQYRYEDTSVQAGRTYYYQLEDVEYSGATTRHGPIRAAAPGLSPALAIGLALGLAALAVLGAAAWRSGRFPFAVRRASNESNEQTAHP
jgi:hypothetical protein